MLHTSHILSSWSLTLSSVVSFSSALSFHLHICFVNGLTPSVLFSSTEAELSVAGEVPFVICRQNLPFLPCNVTLYLQTSETLFYCQIPYHILICFLVSFLQQLFQLNTNFLPGFSHPLHICALYSTRQHFQVNSILFPSYSYSFQVLLHHPLFSLESPKCSLQYHLQISLKTRHYFYGSLKCYKSLLPYHPTQELEVLHLSTLAFQSPASNSQTTILCSCSRCYELGWEKKALYKCFSRRPSLLGFDLNSK